MMPSKFFVFIQSLLPQHALSKAVGFLANSKTLRTPFIKWFTRIYQVNLTEAKHEEPSHYACFNDFFIRELKNNVRPIDNDAVYVSPVDGAVSQAGKLIDGKLLQAKGLDYSLATLLADDLKHIEQFKQGHFATIYLSPKDYHRVHCPAAARLIKMTYVPGKLFSVNQATTNHRKDLFANNERLIFYFDSDNGPYCLVMVGAMIVASIATSFQGEIRRQTTIKHWDFNDSPITFDKGQELGYFKLGSTVILLREEKPGPWKLEANQAVKLGEAI